MNQNEALAEYITTFPVSFPFLGSSGKAQATGKAVALNVSFTMENYSTR